MCTSNETSDFGLHSCLIKSKQAINKREFYRGASVGHVGLKRGKREAEREEEERKGKERKRKGKGKEKERGIMATSETTVHDITHYEYNVMLFKCDGRNRLARGGAGVTACNEIL